MRLARIEHEGRIWLAAVEGDEALILEGLPADVGELLAGPGLDAARTAASRRVPLESVRLLAPIARPPKFLAIGLNYRDHVEEAGMQVPSFPVFFNKQSTCVIGPGDPIHKPRVSDMVDYEGELGIVIGRRCRHVPASRAQEVIAGYLVVNDVTVRDWQLRAPTMTIGKSFDTHGPIGPWLVTVDEVPDPQSLEIRTFVNDELLQDAPTKGMVFDCFQQIETLSTAFTLEPGDVIATGTPAGVGIIRGRFLRPGDVVRVEIEGIGVLENPVIDEPGDTARI